MRERKCVRQDVMAGKSVRVTDLAAELNISPSGLYGLIAKGEVPAIRIGKRVTITAETARGMLGIKSEAIAA